MNAHGATYSETRLEMDAFLLLTEIVLFLFDLVAGLPRAIAAAWRALRRAPRFLARVFRHSIAGR